MLFLYFRITMPNISHIFLIIILLLLLNNVYCGWFSSVGQMRDLVNADKKLIEILRRYINDETEKIDKIKRIADELEATTSHMNSDVDNYLSHPINQYHLMKRLAYRWSHVAEIIAEPTHKDLEEEIRIEKSGFPSDKDLQGSMEALLRLQDTYKLDVQHVISGNIKGHHSYRPLMAEDSYRIGQTAYHMGKFDRCTEWMNETIVMEEDSYPVYFNTFDVLDHLSFCLTQQRRIEEALNVFKKMLTIDPYDERIIDNVEKLKDALTSNETITDQSQTTSDYLLEYEKLCRLQNNAIPSRIEKKLRCYYWNNHNNPRLLFRPVKLEELWPSPHLVQFYDVVSDDEIDVIKALAKRRLERATIYNPDTGKLEHAHYRVSKSAWLRGSYHPVVARVDQRIEDITGLSMKTAEPLQIANYGIGGQYEPHFDFRRTTDAGKVDEKIGNRVATFLTYLSDVDYGGSTVFLHPGLSIKPIKGSAVFWFNLFPSGEGDLRTRHAACPVLVGIKWVSNKWIHVVGQEFRRKCGLSRGADSRLF